MSETKRHRLACTEPTNEVVFIRSSVERITGPCSDPPDRQMQIVLDDLCIRLWCHIVESEIDRQFFSHLAYQGGSSELAFLDMPSWEVPDIWVPAPGGNTVAEKYLAIAVEGGSDDGGHRRKLVAATCHGQARDSLNVREGHL